MPDIFVLGFLVIWIVLHGAALKCTAKGCAGALGDDFAPEDAVWTEE